MLQCEIVTVVHCPGEGHGQKAANRGAHVDKRRDMPGQSRRASCYENPYKHCLKSQVVSGEADTDTESCSAILGAGLNGVVGMECLAMLQMSAE